MHSYFFNSIIHNSEKMELTLVSIRRCVDKENMKEGREESYL
jgi:hypothetical protein